MKTNDLIYVFDETVYIHYYAMISFFNGTVREVRTIAESQIHF